MSSTDDSHGIPTAPPDTGNDSLIECRPTRWFYRRIGLMALLLIGLSMYFFYDGKYGYPKVNHRADVYDWFHNEVLKTYQELDEAGRLDEWPEVSAAGRNPFSGEVWPSGADGGEPRWPNYAASQGWSSDEPKRFSPEEIREQFNWGIGTLIVGLLVFGYGLSQIPSRLKADGVSFTPPKGGAVRFDQVYKIDSRKWKQKGLAYAHYRKADGKQARATIDDLKFGGAQQVLDRLMANFSGELIEKTEESAIPEEAQADQTDDSGTLEMVANDGVQSEARGQASGAEPASQALETRNN